MTQVTRINETVLVVHVKLTAEEITFLHFF